MEPIDLETFRERAGEFDEAVSRTPDIADFCASSSWILNAWEHIHHQPTPTIYNDDGHWLVFCKPDFVLVPLEHFWLFTCPIIGPDPARGFGILQQLLDKDDAMGAVVGGIPKQSALHQSITETSKHVFVEGTACCLIDLQAGRDGFLERRPKKFRRNMRVANERVRAAGVTFEMVDSVDGEEAMDLIWSVHRRCEKWINIECDDIFRHEDFVGFYTGLVHDAATAGTLRLHLARRDGEAIAYVLGVVFGSTYRGLQMAYIKEARDLGIGNALQLENIHSMAMEGRQLYDLGMPADYKERWSDRQQTLDAALLYGGGVSSSLDLGFMPV